MVELSKPRASCAPSGPSVRFSWPASFSSFSVFRFFYLAVVLSLFSEARAQPFYANRVLQTCVCSGDYDAAADYFPHKVTPEFSDDLWNVSYHGSYKVLTINGLNKDGVPSPSWYLYQCGTPAPQVPAGDMLVEIPIRTAAFSSSTVLHLFEFIGQRSSIAEHWDPPSSWTGLSFGPVWTNACLQVLSEQGLFWGVSEMTADVGFGSYFTPKFGSQDVVPILNNAASDPNVFGMAEWIKVVALFFNREQAATQVLAEIKNRYDCHKASVETLVDGGAARPVTLSFRVEMAPWGFTGNCSNSTLFDEAIVKVAGCNDTTHDAPLCQQIVDAGGEPLNWVLGRQAAAPGALANTSEIPGVAETASAGTYVTNLATFLTLPGLDTVDVVYYESDLQAHIAQCPDEMGPAGRLSVIKAWQNGEVYDIYKTTADHPNYSPTDWFEGKDAEPDVLLLDLIETLHPTAVDHERVFLRKIDENRTVLTSEDCDDVFAPLYTGWKATPCDGLSAPAVIEGLEVVQAADRCLNEPPATQPPTTGSGAHVTAALSMAAAVLVAVLL